jgi:AraC family transcriptional regulator
MNSTRNEYLNRINKTFDYIESHIEKAFTLEELASVAHFSKFHFNIIFLATVGETPFQFILRIRLEKAASMLIFRKGESIGSIAFTCGFNDVSVFSRNFKNYFKISPSRYREENSNLSQASGNLSQRDFHITPYFCPELQTLKWRTNMKLNKSIEIKGLPAMTLAYVRHIGPYQGNEELFEELWGRLYAWAGPKKLIGGKDFRSLIIYHDDPNITDDDKLRMSVCITMPSETKVSGEIGKMNIEAATYVIARFHLDATEFEQAWDWVYGDWLPSSGYEPDDKPCFEMYPEEPKNGKFVVDICVPVKPM